MNTLLLRGLVKKVHLPIPVGSSQMVKLEIEVERKRPQVGLKPDDNDRLTVQTWNDMAEMCMGKVKPGTLLLIEAQINQSTWEDKATGQPRSMQVINALNLTRCANDGFLSDESLFDKPRHGGKKQGYDRDR